MALGWALMGRPRLFVLDEPLSDLGRSTQSQVRRELWDWCGVHPFQVFFYQLLKALECREASSVLFTN